MCNATAAFDLRRQIASRFTFACRCARRISSLGRRSAPDKCNHEKLLLVNCAPRSQCVSVPARLSISLTISLQMIIIFHHLWLYRVEYVQIGIRDLPPSAVTQLKSSAHSDNRRACYSSLRSFSFSARFSVIFNFILLFALRVRLGVIDAY